MKKILPFAILISILIFGISNKTNSQVLLDIKVNLEGPFNGADMNTDLNDLNLIPLEQSYNIAPWNYSGTEQVGSIPNTNIVDWILVELRETIGEAYTAIPSTTIHQQAAFLSSDGTVVDLDGISMLNYSGTITDDLYVVIKHRNHLAIMSSGPLVNNAGIYSWDFINQLSKAYYNGQATLGISTFGMMVGDCNGDGRINELDKDPNWMNDAGKFGYYQTDLNMNGQVSNIDKNSLWRANLDEITLIPTCGETLVDERDVQAYSTVQIGTQCWMKENLNIGTMTDGDNDQLDNDIIEKYCYNNIEDSCYVYGGLYQWDEVMLYTSDTSVQGICPQGWHVPTDFEWKVLEGTVDSQYPVGDLEWNINDNYRGLDASKNLKSTYGWSSGGNGTDLFNFTAKAAGLRHPITKVFTSIEIGTVFWTSTESNADRSFHRRLSYDNDGVYRDSTYREGGLSLRCLKDNTTTPNHPPVEPYNPFPEDGATNQHWSVDPAWSCYDPDGDQLTYDLYFGTDSNPPLLQFGLTDTTYHFSSLSMNSIYYWKVVAIDDLGNYIEGPIWSFDTNELPWQCGDQINDIEGNSYNTVQIGTQCWMKENLNIGLMINENQNQTNNSTVEKYCYNDDTTNCLAYGGLYQWDEMMDYSTTPGVQGICPAGWHLPTDEEYKILEGTVDSQYPVGDPEWDGTFARGFDAGLNLKSTNGWNSGGNGTDLFGFNALPSGSREYSGGFSGLGDYCGFWTSTENTTVYVSTRLLAHDYDEVFRNGFNKISGFSIRCLRD
ncbi:MAG: hypothetical protein K8R74_14390 [Bacteroidales bacterium]|nr:hypothetical protein [Bacteroidales bacterium]